uniref:Uncharacterized protein n=1 Tax=Vespula pensylvanica TaxID=30213 RepID=A0A834UB36_VESPE|nr:hypothetical protein H0235_006973 [Vespula pensylvanica]
MRIVRETRGNVDEARVIGLAGDKRFSEPRFRGFAFGPSSTVKDDIYLVTVSIPTLHVHFYDQERPGYMRADEDGRGHDNESSPELLTRLGCQCA